MADIKVHAETLGEVLRACRGAARLTGRELAARMGVSAGSVSQWERGIGEPTVTHFIGWAEATGQDPHAVLTAVITARQRQADAVA